MRRQPGRTPNTRFLSGSFLSGFALMTLELVSSRIVAPIAGSSVFTWTAVIGITLLGLAAGAYLGGRLIDKTPSPFVLAATTGFAALAIAAIPLLIPGARVTVGLPLPAEVCLIILASYLFLIPATLLGMLLPMFLKLAPKRDTALGTAYGSLSMWWSFGSIAGVFVTGFFFISYLGSRATLYGVAIALLPLVRIFTPPSGESSRAQRLAVGILQLGTIVLVLIGARAHRASRSSIRYQGESRYYSIRVVDQDDNGLPASRLLFLDLALHGSVPLGGRPRAISYDSVVLAFPHLGRRPQRFLVVGGGAFVFPNAARREYPDASVQVIELDPAVVRVARQFFGIDPHVETTIGDGRTTLARAQESYDVIFGDASGSFFDTPPHLLTREFNDLARSRLTPSGLYALNIISACSGPLAGLYESVHATLARTFPTQYVFAFGGNEEEPQNIVFVCTVDRGIETEELRHRLAGNQGLAPLAILLRPEAPVDPNRPLLTDDFAPVERLLRPIIRARLVPNFNLVTFGREHPVAPPN